MFNKDLFIVFIPVCTEGDPTEKSPSDEGFTDLEPTVNASAEEVEATSSKTPSILSRDQQELGPSCSGREDFKDKSIGGKAKVKLDDDEDEGVAQTSSIEEGESTQSSLETEKQGGLLDNPANQKETKYIQPKGIEELLNGAHYEIIEAPVDQNSKLSLKEASEVCGCSSPKRQSPVRPAGGAELSEEEIRKKSNEAEVKTWLLERMHAPIEGNIYIILLFHTIGTVFNSSISILFSFKYIICFVC